MKTLFASGKGSLGDAVVDRRLGNSSFMYGWVASNTSSSASNLLKSRIGCAGSRISCHPVCLILKLMYSRQFYKGWFVTYKRPPTDFNWVCIRRLFHIEVSNMLFLWLLKSVVKVSEVVLLPAFCKFGKVIPNRIILGVTSRLETTILLNRAYFCLIP